MGQPVCPSFLPEGFVALPCVEISSADAKDWPLAFSPRFRCCCSHQPPDSGIASSSSTRFTFMFSPFMVWIVAPVCMPTSSGLPSNAKSNFFNTMDIVTVASSMANWSPTHLREPPPNGRKAKSVACSLGYRPDTRSGSNPCQPFTMPLVNLRSNRVGSKVSGFSHNSGLRCRFQVDTKMSVPLSILMPSFISELPCGKLSSLRARRMRTGGSGYSRNDSTRA
mmetsp:Transcript_1161/g.3387  ORF Transcript_1161/g.3387 Transcript_1161/m.3387 type:complete len:223 (-) Transcript_1161:312-980(-)